MLRLDLDAMDSGSAIPSTTREHFYQLDVLWPPLEVQGKFTNGLSAVWQQQQANDAESMKLATLRDALLPQLLSGAIRLRQAEKLVEEVV